MSQVLRGSARLGGPSRSSFASLGSTARGRAARRSTGCAAVASQKAKDTVVPAASFTIPGTLITVAVLSAVADNKVLAAISGILGVFLAIQANRVQFVFDKDALNVLIGKTGAKTENKFVGGENRWDYSKFVNWEFFWPNFPVLVYFKETQTKPEGQIHFFPIIFDAEKLYSVMRERCGPTKNSGSK